MRRSLPVTILAIAIGLGFAVAGTHSLFRAVSVYVSVLRDLPNDGFFRIKANETNIRSRASVLVAIPGRRTEYQVFHVDTKRGPLALASGSKEDLQKAGDLWLERNSREERLVREAMPSLDGLPLYFLRASPHGTCSLGWYFLHSSPAWASR